MESLEQKHISMIAEAQRRGRGDAGGIRLCFEVLALASAIDRSCALRLAPHRLSEGKFVLLCLLHDRSEGLAPHELATRAGVTRATVTGLLDGLERDGYVSRQAHREDRRKILVTLTPSGQVLADALFDEHSQWIASLFNEFEPEDRKTLSNLLARVRHNLAEGKHTDTPSAEGA